MTMYAGILFADLRGFTARFDRADPQEASTLLRRFYRCAEDALFPEALIDKLIGDEVMALYLPRLGHFDPEGMPAVMLDHARELLRAVGYGSRDSPSSRWASGSTSAMRSSAISVSGRSSTSLRSATS